jgi:hypothetical protein
MHAHHCKQPLALSSGQMQQQQSPNEGPVHMIIARLHVHPVQAMSILAGSQTLSKTLADIR